MSVDGWNTVLVLGGIRSGKSEFAESLVAEAATVRYLATAPGAEPGDAEWAARIEAHRNRRPETWTVEETTDEPRRLADVIASAQPHETLLVDDLGGWVTVLLDPAHQPADDTATIAELAAAVRDCAARVVLVSPEVGLSLVPTTPLGRAFTDALGAANRAVADACDAVALVVAGQPCWLKPGAPLPATSLPATPGVVPAAETPPAGAARPAGVPAQPGPAGADPLVTPADADAPAAPADPDQSASAAGSVTPLATPSAGTPPPWAAATPETALPDVLTPTAPPAPQPSTAWAAPTMALPVVATGLVIQSGMELPMPDEYAGQQAVERLATLDMPGAGLGVLERAVGFAGATQGTPTPRPWGAVRVLLLHGDHEGGASAGSAPGESARRAAQARAGIGVLARLAAESGATLQVVDAPTAAPIEAGPALTAEQVESALRYGWRLAEEAAETGVRLLVLAACGAGTEAAAAAVLAATAGAEPPAVLARVVVDGAIDDTAWMIRCAAVRDALHRARGSSRDAKAVLAEFGGGDLTVATGILLGATARRIPVLLDGPVGVAAGLVSRDLAGQARHWCLLPDHGGHPAVRLAADVLGLSPLTDLRLDLGEGANALAALPLLRSLLTLAATLPPRGDGVRPDGHHDDGGHDGDGGHHDGDDRDGDGRDGDDRHDDAGRPGGPEDAEPDFAEPEPAGPGPTTNGGQPSRPGVAGWHAG
ncbi:bifunctional adenosylcobinamide kinase/adenosylcobinamide-phosphate guanylyltransferase [Micromonospora sp. WMMD882]|uniref:bifunctional adenosylcobinamide kinase/adenosylcobinamide-phosphate guanylyltransferase n=1 Tax=Micromonospora sp. WMMD882 TaxID=3015151 RepID=UPI00248AA4CB|nr:bifunctional adenosylcobinamide kinase/adenosylcobinamide-phosphate guanylyltransferase [Micromonospora sp. WMMD882]WBB79928.1 bifunctional adenosylcobinamide kinase/adenosylcobinamide-phosphate guanylyltransferase [Micromonospora sp. WMMD882]